MIGEKRAVGENSHSMTAALALHQLLLHVTLLR